jgi:hypothetical protein
LCKLDAALPTSLDAVVAIHERLLASVAAGYEYEHVANAQLNEITDRSVVDGKLRTDAPPLSAAMTAAFIAKNGDAHQMLGTITFVSTLSVSKHLSAFREAISRDDVLGSFHALRATIEHVAHYQLLLKRLGGYSVPSNFEDANVMLGEVRDVLMKSAYATRVDWNALFTGDPDENIEKNRLKYEPQSNRADRTAETVMKAIDALGKKVKGTRAVYDLLCEFTHPNVGNLLAVTEKVDPFKDHRGVVWVKKRLSAAVPHAFLHEWHRPAVYIFLYAHRCLVHFETLLADGDKERAKVLSLVQVVVRRLVTAYPSLFEPYSSCPCGAGTKVKFCCGKR